jgi:hypothetical protein
MTEKINLCEGKYTLINDNGKLTALRYGEYWDRDLTGDNLVYSLFVEAIRMREELDAFKSQMKSG